MPLPNPSMSFTPFDPLPASELNDLVENIESLADGTGFDAGAIDTEDLANGAATADKTDFGAATDSVTTNESTSSDSFTNLATVGPQVTVTVPVSGKVKVDIACQVTTPATVGQGAYIGVALSGANTVAADINNSLIVISPVSAGMVARSGISLLFTGLTPGATTFTMQYRRESSGSPQFRRRSIIVTPTS